MWLIRNYYHDLTEFFAGDEGRFSRMVEREGKSLATAHPHGWAQHIVNCTTVEAVEFYRDELQAIYAQLVEWNLPTAMAVIIRK
jgi:phage gp29-like protein